MGYHYSIEYKAGKNNQVVDVLSPSFHLAMLVIHSSFFDEIKHVVASSPSLQELLPKFYSNLHSMPSYTLTNGLLYCRCWFLIPAQSRDLINKILQEFHASPLMGHVGFLCTHVRIAIVLMWELLLYSWENCHLFLLDWYAMRYQIFYSKSY